MTIQNKVRSWPTTLLAAVASGFETTVLLWLAWLAVHIPALKSQEGLAAPSGPSLIVFGVVLIAGIGLGCLQSPRGARPIQGVFAGLVVAVVNLLMLGSLLGSTAESTTALEDVASTFRDSAPAILLGFTGACAAGGLIAGLLAAALPVGKETAASPRAIVARLSFALIGVLICLISIGGAVTSADAGLAVPDAVTTYGRLPWLYPLELMAEPRIFLEHTHRLFGWLAGVTAFVTALTALIAYPRRWWIGVGIGLGGLIAFLAPLGAWSAEVLPEAAALSLSGVLAIALLVWTTRATLAGRVGHGAFGVGCLIAMQGIFGIVRVSESLTWMAAFHGLFAQAILCATAILAVRLVQRAHKPVASGAAFPPVRRVAWITLVVLGIQIALGVLTRHFGHPAFTGLHMVWSLTATALVIILGVVLMRDAPESGPARKPTRFAGMALHTIVFLQFLLGWWALAMVGHSASSAELPTAETLATIKPVPLMEAMVTTAHQALGALLVGCTGAAAALARKPAD